MLGKKIKISLKKAQNKMNMISMVIIFFVLMCAASMIIYLISSMTGSKSHLLDFACSSNLKYENTNANNIMNTNILLVLRNDGKGMITFDGNITNEKGNYKLSRVVYFNYEYFNSRSFILREKTSTLSKRDTIPNGLFEERYFPTDTFYVAPIDNIKNALLIGNRLSPVLICITD
ncbi:hypothetical protein [Kosakonia oryziphila]|jgi:hypothetical protein|uniref:Uncharacterized protein n=1 Tax=Kosakonia oryziphila TaxID=1005667 RepID=A0A1C4GFM4_9ENTR|nr:hypothetical protein [Kosakonia oryziphila]SCC66977.1 hypothetical protein GA0061070_106519 [Kosakonia oryziphila]